MEIIVCWSWCWFSAIDDEDAAAGKRELFPIIDIPFLEALLAMEGLEKKQRSDMIDAIVSGGMRGA